MKKDRFKLFLLSMLSASTLLPALCKAESLTAEHPWEAWTANPGIELPASSPTQTDLSAHPLNLAELTDLALRNNPATRQAWAAARAEAAGQHIAEAEYWPELSASVPLSASHTSDSTRSTRSSTSTQTTLTPALSLSYVLLDFGLRAANEEAARYTTLAANLNQNRVLQNVVLQVEQAYYTLQGTQQLIDAIRETEHNALTSLDAANARREAGLATIGDVYQAETALAQTRLELRRTEGQASVARGTLANAIGLPVNTRLLLAPIGNESRQSLLDNVDTLLDTAKRSRPDVIAAHATTQASRADIQAAKAKDRPTVELSASAGSSFTANNGFGGNNASLTLQLRIPLVDGGRRRFAIEQAQARAEQTDAARERVVRQVELDVWQAYFDAQTAHASIDSADALLKSAGRSYEVAQGRYRSGVGTLLDVLTAQAAEANARVEVIQAKLGWYSAISKLHHAVGSMMPLENSQTP